MDGQAHMAEVVLNVAKGDWIIQIWSGGDYKGICLKLAVHILPCTKNQLVTILYEFFLGRMIVPIIFTSSPSANCLLHWAQFSKSNSERISKKCLRTCSDKLQSGKSTRITRNKREPPRLFSKVSVQLNLKTIYSQPSSVIL